MLFDEKADVVEIAETDEIAEFPENVVIAQIENIVVIFDLRILPNCQVCCDCRNCPHCRSCREGQKSESAGIYHYVENTKIVNVADIAVFAEIMLRITKSPKFPRLPKS